MSSGAWAFLIDNFFSHRHVNQVRYSSFQKFASQLTKTHQDWTVAYFEADYENEILTGANSIVHIVCILWSRTSR